MTDKEKLNAIRAEVEEYVNAAHKAHTNITEGNFAHLLSFIDSLQEESTIPDIVDKHFDEMPCEEPVSEDLHAVAKEYSDNITDKIGYKLQLRRAVCYGAKWQEEQFEKNRLKHCHAQTKEEADIEMDFAMGIIEKEHRQPTFDDAIKYGMRLQKEQMMKDAFDAELDDVCGFLTISVPYHNGIAGDKVKVIIIKSE